VPALLAVSVILVAIINVAIAEFKGKFFIIFRKIELKKVKI
jgi:hypothetical protein